MNRAEHLQWAKGRALEYADRGDIAGALASVTSDMNKHDELADHPGIMLGHMGVLAGTLRTVDDARRFIEGLG